MKLIIDIPEDVYTRLFDNGIQDNEIAIDDICEMARAIRKGTPLDDIRAEIQAEIDNSDEPRFVGACRFCIDIIRKYIGIGEQE